MSHNTDAQDAPVASQEAEAREAVLKAYDESGSSPTFETDEAFDNAFFAALDAYAAAIRASERERYAALVEAAEMATGEIEMAMYLLHEVAADPEAWMDTASNRLRAAIAALEGAGSA